VSVRPSPSALLVAVAVTMVLGFAVPALAQLSEADVFVAEGVIALEDKKYEEALGHFRRALEREPDHIEALYYAGVALMAQDKAGEALQFLERAQKKGPDEVSIAFQLGLAYFALNDYDRAQPLLEDVFNREPTLDALGYYVGFLRYRQRNYQGALRAFRIGRTTDRTIAQLTRFYSGLALAAIGLPSQATAEIEQALRLQPASPLTGPAQRLRESFASTRDVPRRFRAEIRLGGYFDDNVTTQPDRHPSSETVEALRHAAHESWGQLAGLRLEYDWLSAGQWTSTIGYSFFTTYNDRLPSFNIIDHLATLLVSRHDLIGRLPLVSGFQYSFEDVMLDKKELLQRHAGSLFATLVENQGNLTNAIFKVEIKEFNEVRPLAREQFQDGNNYMLGLLHVFRFAEDRHLVKLGYQFDYEDAQGSNFEYRGHRFLASGQYTLPWYGIRLIYDFGLHDRAYLNKHTLFPDEAPKTRKRSDQEYSHAFRVEVPLPRKFKAAFDYQRTDQRSNLAPFTYTRNIYTLSVTWSY
jgi:Flp pilus assembly protein TadD